MARIPCCTEVMEPMRSSPTIRGTTAPHRGLVTAKPHCMTTTAARVAQ